MSKPITSALLVGLAFCSSSPLSAATYTVSKDGSGQYTTIMAAIKVAGPGDIVQILDAAAYPEQVTIDSTKNGLTLCSKNPTDMNKPRIIWRDTVNVSPRNYEESLVDSQVTFQQNGAVQILAARGVTIDGIAIDGGGPYCFGHENVWENRYPLQHGNSALALFMSGAAHIKNCSISNAYFGIYCCDINQGGINAHPNPADNEPWKIVPLSGFGKTGNHVVECNRIHHNSVGIGFESSWDLGSTVRYNLMYENHHCSDAFAAEVKGKTSEGANQPGGAMMFKDVILSPLAIYNNTFWHNFLEFVGDWKAGYHHLVFNNIFGAPYRYLNNETIINSTYMDICRCLPNRMHNCVFAAHTQAPDSLPVNIFNGMPRPDSVNGRSTPGGLITAANSFPASAEIRWLETPFKSTDTASADFLVPDWDDTLVQKYILNKGWTDAGVLDPDGSAADLGAITQAGGRPNDATIIIPTSPVMLSGNSATVNFTLSQRIGTMSAPLIKLHRWVGNLPYNADAWSSNWTAGIISAANITAIPASTKPMEAASNTYSFTVPAQTTDYGFLEMIIEGMGAGNTPYASAAGFIPYRKLDYKFVVDVLDAAGTVITEVRTGDTVILRIRSYTVDNIIFPNTVSPVEVRLQSGFMLLSTATDPPVALTLPSGVPGTSAGSRSNVMFTSVPPGGIEAVIVSGQWLNGSYFMPFLGCSNGIKILPGTSKTIVPFHRPFPSLREFTVTYYDLKGRTILSYTIHSSTPVTKPERMAQLMKRTLNPAVYLVQVREKGKNSSFKRQLLTIIR
jgi:hypothetical protein